MLVKGSWKLGVNVTPAIPVTELWTSSRLIGPNALTQTVLGLYMNLYFSLSQPIHPPQTYTVWANGLIW